MSRFNASIEHIPTIKEYPIIASELKKQIKALPVTWRSIDMEDSYYYFTDWEGWGKVIDYLKPKIPKFITDKFDCDAFSRWFNVMVALTFQINTCGIVEGWMGKARHKWCVIYDGEFYQMEPQTGRVFDFPDDVYIADEILVG